MNYTKNHQTAVMFELSEIRYCQKKQTLQVKFKHIPHYCVMAPASPERHQTRVVAERNPQCPVMTHQAGGTCVLFWIAMFLFAFFQRFLRNKNHMTTKHAINA